MNFEFMTISLISEERPYRPFFLFIIIKRELGVELPVSVLFDSFIVSLLVDAVFEKPASGHWFPFTSSKGSATFGKNPISMPSQRVFTIWW